MGLPKGRRKPGREGPHLGHLPQSPAAEGGVSFLQTLESLPEGPDKHQADPGLILPADLQPGCSPSWGAEGSPVSGVGGGHETLFQLDRDRNHSFGTNHYKLISDRTHGKDE